MPVRCYPVSEGGSGAWRRRHNAMTRYLIRFDDVCPTMNWSVWSRVEAALIRHQVAPILAVVPQNRDPKLRVDQERADFWDRVRDWQARRWSIGWHGWQHLYTTADPGIIGLNRRSEFAGIPRSEQFEMLRAARDVFSAQNVQPQVWVAPGHSFDWNTVEVLSQLGMSVVSDGFFTGVRIVRGTVFVPQQLWRFREMPGGLWTVCLHVNHWTERDVEQFERALVHHKPRIVGLQEALAGPHARAGVSDRLFATAFRRSIVWRRWWSERRRSW